MALAMVFSLAACGNSTPAAPADSAPAAATASTDTYSMIDNFDITTLDYVYNNKSSNGDYTNNFIEGLLTQDSHGVLVGGMAKEWSANEDASEWTFVIRDDAVWSTSSGEEFDAVTAEDFVTGLKHAADSKSETLGLVADLIVGLRAYSEGTGSWDDVGVKADGNVLTYTLTGPCGYFDGMTTSSPSTRSSWSPRVLTSALCSPTPFCITAATSSPLWCPLRRCALTPTPTTTTRTTCL